MSASNKEIVRRVEAAWDAGRLDELDQYFAPDFRSHAAVPGLPPGLAGAKLAHQASMAAFPDRKVVIRDLIAEGDKVVVRTSMSGTNRGGLPFLGIPANGKRMEGVESVSIYGLVDGKIFEHWGLNDTLGIMAQLGEPRAAVEGGSRTP